VITGASDGELVGFAVGVVGAMLGLAEGSIVGIQVGYFVGNLLFGALVGSGVFVVG